MSAILWGGGRLGPWISERGQLMSDIMNQRISVPAVITSVLAAIGSIGAMLAGVFAFGSWYGSLDHSLREVSMRLVSIERGVGESRDRIEDLATKLMLMDARLQFLERERTPGVRTGNGPRP